LIIDTSALVASVYREDGAEAINRAFANEARTAWIPTPVLFEYHRVTSLKANVPNPVALELQAKLLSLGVRLLPFDEAMAMQAAETNELYGSGNERGGLRNLLDLMVFTAAKVRDLPILCTGKDFPATDAKIHPASRPV
jgi:ribonuclease VapC